MNINLKRFDRTCIVIIALVSVAFGYFSVSHIIDKSRQYSIERGILSKTIREVNLAETSLADLRVILLETKKELNYLNERIPESGKIGLLLKQIDSLMKQRRITLISLRPMIVREEDAYLKNVIQLMFSGNFINVYNLIQDLEKMNRIVEMEQVTITKQENSDHCRVESTINVFEQKRASDTIGIS